MSSFRFFVGFAAALIAAGLAVPAPQETEFFEKRIRPVLAEKCYLCHGAQSKPVMGSLRLDSREGILKGGDRGPAIVPGDPDKSLLIQAISYRQVDLQMPPNGRLADDQIADLVAWVKMGAPDPRSAGSSPVTDGAKGIDFEEGRRFWSFLPILDPPLPSVKQSDWPASPVDRFILAKLEEKGLRPALPCDKRAWIRRVTFDLIGLPPTPQEVEAFLADGSRNAQARIVDRLLASPHYGERWGRHWLDLVRFAETNGHEFDNEKLDAWRYRDYVIRVFNNDVPYDQFVKEHIAGDLMPQKRISPDGAHWESPLGTSFYWFDEVLNSATDSIKSRADQVDNQIDVLSKAFLGLTVSCARCHDHKFDPIPTADYYALGGMMHSTDVTETVIDAPPRVKQIASVHQRIEETNEQIRRLLQPVQNGFSERLKDRLLAAAQLIVSSGQERQSREEELAKSQGLNVTQFKAWIAYLEQARKERDHIFYPFVAITDRLAKDRSASFAGTVADIRRELEKSATASLAPGHAERGDIVYEDFEKSSYEGWSVAGQAFGEGPQRETSPNQGLRGYRGEGSANSFHSSDRFVGSLTSAKFKMPKLYLHVRMAGSKESPKGEKGWLRLIVVADGHKSQHLLSEGNDNFRWKTVRLTKEIGRICYFEIVDRSREGHLVIDKIVLSDSKDAPGVAAAPDKRFATLLEQPGVTTLESLAEAYETLIKDTLRGKEGSDSEDQWLSSVLMPAGKLEDTATFLSPAQQRQLRQLQDRRSALEDTIPASTFAMVARDENPHDIRIHIRGNHKTPGAEVPRRFLQIVAGRDQVPVTQGSGRLQIAGWMTGAQNPLLARVMVNRIWKHHFGHGIVRSTDNFGKTGQRPTHPELLDFMANRFRASGWSVKAMQRLIVLSSAYGMSSQTDERAARIDPQNKLLHHMPVRRLEAEVIRDTIHAVAGTLDRRLFGPSVTPHISKYQDGRGKPQSGPLDGNGRRSLYIQVRRNFITPMFLAFDYPLPVSTIGARSVSTVPSQALMMMNNEFVAMSAKEWGRRLTAAESESRRRVTQMYLSAFGRPPEEGEMTAGLQFIESQVARYDTDNRQQEAWADLCHVLLNSAEFIYVR